jgi:hypothetical protein
MSSAPVAIRAHPFTLASARMGEHHLHMTLTGISRRVVAEPVKLPITREAPAPPREPVQPPKASTKT